MNKQPQGKPSGKKTQPAKPQDEFQPRPNLDGKNDSGPDPEVHGRDIPPQ
jgi:hypothetical protein